MQEKHLHIICHDVPYPADYGGVFDPFYKIKALHALGVKIHLHCFEYGRDEQPELHKYCAAVNYYSRREGHKGFSHKLPYIVCSRSNHELLDNLLKDDFPILAEGIHCSYLLNDDRFSSRDIFLRLQNVECLYYHELYRSTSSLAKKIYYYYESRILRAYESRIAQKAFLLAMTDEDASYYKVQFDADRIESLPVFLPFEEVSAKAGRGCYCLYHGNLSVPENEKAVIWLLSKVFNDLPFPLVIAGKRPSSRLSKIVRQFHHACLVADPSESEMQDIIEKAQLHILPSFNCTGIKLKLLHALFTGRHCIVNPQAVRGTGLEKICHIGDHAESFKSLIEENYQQELCEGEINKRREILLSKFDNRKNANQLIQWIW